MNKIITKILMAIISCSVIVAVSIGYLSVMQASKILRQEAYDKFHYVSSNYANEFSARLKKIEGSVDTLESFVASSFDSNQFAADHGYRSGYMKKMNGLLKRIGDKSPGIQGIYVVINPELTGQVFESWFINNGKGDFIYQEPEDISTFFPANKDMAWYYEPIRKKKGVWIPPYVDATIDVKMISYTRAIFNEGLLIGVAGIDIAFEDMEKEIEDMKLYESGYSFLINTDLTILLHPSLETGTYIPDIKNEALNEVIASMTKNKSDVIEYVFQNNKKIMGFSKLSNGWILSVSTVASDIFMPIVRLKKSIMISVVFLLIITGIIGLLISKSITAPINRLRDMAALISQGQHDIELDLNSNSEIGELSKSIQIMTKKLVASHEELKEISDDMEYLAHHDTLTGLPNRRFGESKLESIIENKQDENFLAGIMFIDLDNFKTINDTYGHRIGDKLLIQASNTMKQCIRKEDMVFRFGGDEFMVAFKDMHSLEAISELANRILSAVSEPIVLDGIQLNMSCSIGIAILGEHGDNIKKIMINADVALYDAKEDGRNTFRFFS
ncbi:diguanylate cyclase domain-containing protein [Desulfospira joergensenii]|uniref:diguanylate cyclase domain-containing protein n=1 Tax=Desulfospira joergensenii TaxID=53329 RepID=UPI0003B67301|nr:diguanylate cyclase [Desulfospira joergensenii]